MSSDAATTYPLCACETDSKIAPLRIGAGLSRLPRQRGVFHDFKKALLERSQLTPTQSLSQWAADDPQDLGLMLIDSWAYLLDVLSFYDSETAQNSYLNTASNPQATEQITDLLGYVAQPASAASVELSLIAAGKDPVCIPKGTAFRSDPIGDEKPQVFELDSDQTIYPQINSVTLDAVRPRVLGEVLWVRAMDSSLRRGQKVAVQYVTTSNPVEKQYQILTLKDVKSRRAADGERYRKVEFEEALEEDLKLADVDSVRVLRFAQTILPNPYDVFDSTDTLAGALVFDAQYPAIGKHDIVMVEGESGFQITAINQKSLLRVSAVPGVGIEATFPVTQVTVNPTWNLGEIIERIHVRPYEVARAVNPAKIFLDGDDLSQYRAVRSPVEAFGADETPPTHGLIKGARNRHFKAQVSYLTAHDDDLGAVRVDEPSKITEALRMPVRIFGNVVTATRGESVQDEIIGQSDGRTPYQRFKLKKKPLTYLPDQSGTGQLIPVLDIRVNGTLWSRVDSFLGQDSQAKVYKLRTQSDDESYIIFGAAVPPSGTKNITASYRFGAGSAKPPSGAIRSIAKGANKLDGILWSTAPVGGSDKDDARSMTRNAPQSVLTLGRAVSLQNYEALALQYPGVVSAQVGWAQDRATQRAQVKVWIVSNGGSAADSLSTYLEGLGDPDTVVIVEEAASIAAPITADIKVDPRYLTDSVLEAARIALLDEETGYLSLQNFPLGRNLYRSEVVAKLMTVQGVLSVTHLDMGANSTDAGLICPEGMFLDTSQTVIGGAI